MPQGRDGDGPRPCRADAVTGHRKLKRAFYRRWTEKLHTVHVSEDMKKAIVSLGDRYGFRLEIQ